VTRYLAIRFDSAQLTRRSDVIRIEIAHVGYSLVEAMFDRPKVAAPSQVFR